MLVLRSSEVREILGTHRDLVVEAVGDTYRRHAAGLTTVPHSIFLRFPDMPRDRIIGLPAYVRGDEEPSSIGMKWIASFPDNVARGIDRASAVIVLNDPKTGRPTALIEGSEISAHRTAASAAIGARVLSVEAEPEELALIGCGPINRQVLYYLRDAFPSLSRLRLFDLDRERAQRFGEEAEREYGLAMTVGDSAAETIAGQRLIALATTAPAPHLDLGPAAEDATVLHVSLRDLHVEEILGAQNVVDDADHVSREQTSVHLAEQAGGSRDFIDAEIGAILRDPASFRRDPARRAIYSPFGLGSLDIAVADRIRGIAQAAALGVAIDGFLPGE
ncbi:2,3-diaminopropionate biosynthesis protein SbnB [Streptomyces sp. NPDC051658]|uniref:2,3-diaminopropionate biosynthesis protein SbnB n=1 Tax=unclassified Streptomyces TaxID=2593676 RepID=UPI0037B7BA28|nr:2,3-diaminopropionate biosynthesis protein SbnB [Streptomyces sp. NBC_00984]